MFHIASTACLEVRCRERGIQDADGAEAGKEQRRKTEEAMPIFNRVQVVGGCLCSVAMASKSLPSHEGDADHRQCRIPGDRAPDAAKRAAVRDELRTPDRG